MPVSAINDSIFVELSGWYRLCWFVNQVPQKKVRKENRRKFSMRVCSQFFLILFFHFFSLASSSSSPFFYFSFTHLPSLLPPILCNLPIKIITEQQNNEKIKDTCVFIHVFNNTSKCSHWEEKNGKVERKQV